jgi:hypothetical protein
MGAPEYLEAGCCITNECVKEYTKECPCSEDIRKINESILDISATIKSYQASQYKPSLCEDKKDPAPHCRELQAQLKMAKWAMIAGLTAIGALGALIVTLILQALANWSLANQNKVAQDSVDVAKDTLEQARIASRRELRAYLGIVEIKSNISASLSSYKLM